MFETIKAQVPLEKVLADISNITLIEAGEWSEPEDKCCPFCKHMDCFKVAPGNERWQCFSCDEGGDVIAFVAKAYNVSQVDAAKAIAKEYKIDIPTSYNAVREVTRLAADYYRNCFINETGSYSILGGKNPAEYQREVRGHSDEIVANAQIGWSDGGLIDYLRGVGFEDEILESTGLISKSGKGDFLPRKSFIYHHMVGGQVGHFTFKDPTKQLEYQVANKFKHQGWIFYGQNDVKAAHTVVVVEGENDRLSVMSQLPEGWAVIACIGMISGAQVEWLVEHCHGKDLITIFDPDEGGEKYQAKILKSKARFKSLVQVVLEASTDPEKKADDIDDLIKAGGDLQEIIAKYARVDVAVGATPTVEIGGVEVPVAIEASESTTSGCITEAGGAYYRIRYKDGVPSKTKLTNFVIRLKNIYIQAERREREVQFIREDGKRSRPVNVSSEVKVSLKAFKSLVANAMDGSFYGREDDLAVLWDFVYQGVSEKEVHLPAVVGHVRELKGWLFRDSFISDVGDVSKRGEDGVIWIGGSSSVGIKAVPLSDDSGGSDENIPDLVTDLDKESRKQFEKDFVQKIAENLGNVGVALTALAWAKSCAYSDRIFQWRRDFPFLFLWGRHGRGKTYIAKWLAGLYGIGDFGYTTISGMKRSVGFYRKLAYYASLPVIIDEVRADKDTTEMYGTFRAWYQRSGRTLGTQESFGIREQKVLSTFIFAGQDQFSDSALRQRCIPIRIPITDRELDKTFRWIEDHRQDMSSVGLEWILESSKADWPDMIERMNLFSNELRDIGCHQRTSLNWAMVAEFGMDLAREYFPDFDYVEYIKEACMDDVADQESEDVLAQFFQVIEGLLAGEGIPKLSSKHVCVDGGYLCVWITEVFRVVERELVHSAREEFSRKALLELLKEETWCSSSEDKGGHPRAVMADGIQRRVLKFNLETAPEYVKVLGQHDARIS
jgi:5S rRNA maturation endonuclease (ribonuclease M5)